MYLIYYFITLTASAFEYILSQYAGYAMREAYEKTHWLISNVKSILDRYHDDPQSPFSLETEATFAILAVSDRVLADV